MNGKPLVDALAPEGAVDDLDRELKRTGDKAREYTERRDRAIVEAHRAGKSYRHIAERTGLHFTSVANIVNRKTDNRGQRWTR